MSGKCYKESCNNKPSYSCSCDNTIRLCKQHRFNHSKLEGIHNIKKINVKAITNAVEARLKDFKDKRQSILLQGNILIDEIVKLLKIVEEAISCKEEELLHIAKSCNNYDLLEENIANISKIAFNINFTDDFINYSKKFITNLQEFSEVSLEKALLEDTKFKENIKKNEDTKENFQIAVADNKNNDDNELF